MTVVVSSRQLPESMSASPSLHAECGNRGLLLHNAAKIVYLKAYHTLPELD